MTAPKVTQADRGQASAALLAIAPKAPAAGLAWYETRSRMILTGQADDHPFVQAFAAHRIAHEPKWLPIDDFAKSGVWVLAKQQGLHPTSGIPFTPCVVRWDNGCWDDDSDDPCEDGLWPLSHYIPLDTLPTLPEEPAIRSMKGSKT